MRSSRLIRLVAFTICCPIALAVFFVLVFSSTALALVREISLNQLTVQADAIVVGTVTNTTSFWQDTRIYTDVTISLDQTIKGAPLEAEITVRRPGGQVGEIREWVEDAPDFAVGERTVLFLDRTEGPPFEVVGAFQGKLPVENDAVLTDSGYVPISQFVAGVSAMLQGGELAPAETQPQATPDPAAGPACTITEFNPTRASGGTGSRVNISGTDFDSAGTVKFLYKGTELIEASPILPWGDTLIQVAEIPVMTVPPWKAASSGPVTVSPKDNPACTSDSAFEVTFSYSKDKWQGADPTVAIRINPNTDDIPDEDEQPAVWAGANTWNGTASFSFDLGADTEADGLSNNGDNEIMWGTSLGSCGPGGTLAATYCWIWGSGTITECDFQFNDNCAWDASGAPLPGKYDIETVAVHEFGHFLTLNDLYGTGAEYDKAKIMYGYGDDGVTQRALHADDRAGIRWIYPPAVGGIAELPDVAEGALSMAERSGSSAGDYVALAGGLAAAVVAVSAGAWYARRRWLS